MSADNNIENHIVDFLLKEEETIDYSNVDSWINESKENKTKFYALKKILKSTDFLSQSKQFDTREGWLKTNQSIQKHNVKMRKIKDAAYTIAGMAAMLLIVMGFLFLSNPTTAPNNRIEMATSYGSQSEVVLPDGTKVFLNSGSNLSYRYNKHSKIREVEFSGEGFFEVAKNEQPFTIETTEGLKVEVLGTKFNLTAYSNDKTIQTALVEGKVEITNKGGQKVLMAPGQIVEFEKDSEQLNLISGNINHNSAWRKHKMYLNNSSLAETCKKLERMYDVRIKFQPEKLGEEIHHTGVLQEETILDILEALKELSNISYKLKGKEITIMSD